MKKLVGIMHGSINISGGLKFQKLIYEAILATKKHVDVMHEYPVQLLKETGEEDRNEHNVDILCENEDAVLAINSKPKSFNFTISAHKLLLEYRSYKKAIEKKFPGKKVEYILLKDEYDGTDAHFKYLNEHGFPAHNTETYLIDNYGIDFDTLEDTRQRLSVAKCRSKFAEFGVDDDTIDTMVNLFEVLD